MYFFLYTHNADIEIHFNFSKLPIQGELLNQCVSFIGNFRCQQPGVIFVKLH